MTPLSLWLSHLFLLSPLFSTYSTVSSWLQDSTSVQARVMEWANGVFEIARRLNRLDCPEQSYYYFISENKELTKLKTEVCQLPTPGAGSAYAAV